MSRQFGLFRRLVNLLFPEDFRAAYGRDMERTFRAQYRDAAGGGLWGVLRLWTMTIAGLLRVGPRAHLAQLRQDVAYSWRTMQRSPAFTIVTIATLAVGIGATTAIFSIVDTVLLKPLPYPDADRLVRLYERKAADQLLHNSVSGLNFLDWQQQTTAFARMAAFRARAANVSVNGEPRVVRAARASATFFDVLGVRPALGRTMSADEDRQGAPVVVIDDGFWQSGFARDPSVVGRAVDVDGVPHAVVGVLPRGFRFNEPLSLWLPLGVYPGIRTSRGSHNLGVVARLAANATLRQAEADLARVSTTLARDHPGTNTGWDAVVEPMHASSVRDVRSIAWVLFGAVAFVLLVTCANISSLLLARASGRLREFAVRASLGASRARLVRQLITEGTCLSLAGGAAGLAGAALLLDVARRFDSFDVPRLAEAALDGRTLLAAAGISMLSGLLVALAPAVQVGRRSLQAAINDGGRGAASGRERRRLQTLLAGGQIALAVVLLIGAGLMVRSLLMLTRVDPGFRAEDVLALDLTVAPARYTSESHAARFYERVLAATEAIPGVRSAALISDAPLTGGEGHWSNQFEVVGRPPKPAGQADFAYLRWASSAYFATVDVRLRRGRIFDASDAIDRPAVVVINEAMARRFFPGTDPIGQQLKISFRTAIPRTIVGIVTDTRQTSLESEAGPQMYVPYSQAAVGWGTLLVRSGVDPGGLASSIAAAVRSVDAQQPVSNVRTLGQVVSASVAPQRLTMRALAVFAIAAMLLAVMGTYGVVAQGVRQRTHEIGVRIAIGARPTDVLWMIVADGVKVSTAGVAVGMAGALMLGRVLAGLLYGVSPLDPITFALVALSLVAAAIAAAWIPARRATRIEPVAALRN